MRVDTEREGGVRVAELVGDPPDALAGAEGQRGPGVARRVQSQRSDAALGELTANPLPATVEDGLAERLAPIE